MVVAAIMAATVIAAMVAATMPAAAIMVAMPAAIAIGMMPDRTMAIAVVPAVPAPGPAPAITMAPAIAAPIEAGTVPAIVVPAIAPAAIKIELRGFHDWRTAEIDAEVNIGGFGCADAQNKHRDSAKKNFSHRIPLWNFCGNDCRVGPS